MAHRAHLFSLRIGHALRESLSESRYGKSRFLQDLIAGLTVGVIAIPLSMALAIASGVPPQYGLYTAIIAGLIIPLTGGSRFSVSGPTAAFVVILYPVVQQYGFAGLLIASLLSGVILLGMAWMRLGRYIEYIPEPVTLGFTGGIAVVIAVLQIKDLLGLHIADMPVHFTDKLMVIAEHVPELSLPSLIVGIATLAVMLLWPRLKTPISPHLPAVISCSLLAAVLAYFGYEVATIGSSFSYLLPDGQSGAGVPPILPDFEWPWLRTLPGEETFTLTWQTAQDLLSAAFAIAMLGAIESLLCAVILDGMSGKKHSANSELLGQGIANIITPFFGGITATAAIARSAANFKAGAQTPIASMIHAAVVLLGLILLAPLLSYLPMASMAALLLIVAWNMSEAHKSLHIIRTAQGSEILVFATCFSLTVLFDMVVAISAGIVLASLLFMKQMAEMTRLHDITKNRKVVDINLPEGWKVYKINGPLFFAAAHRIFGELALESRDTTGILLYLDGVSVLDSGGVSSLVKFIDTCRSSGTTVYLADFQQQPLKTLVKARFTPDETTVFTFSTLAEALAQLNELNTSTFEAMTPAAAQ